MLTHIGAAFEKSVSVKEVMSAEQSTLHVGEGIIEHEVGESEDFILKLGLGSIGKQLAVSQFAVFVGIASN